jgi:magnesium transporter
MMRATNSSPGHPNHVSVQSEGTAARVRVFARPAIDNGRGRRVAIENLGQSLADREIIWIDIVNPESSTIPLLHEQFQLEALTVEDCLLPLRMPKLDLLGEGVVFVAAFAITLEATPEPRLRAIEVAMVVGPRYLVTARHESLPVLDSRLEPAMSSELSQTEPSAAWLAHTALDALVDAHLPMMLRAAEIAEDLEEQLVPLRQHASLDSLEQLIVLRRDLLAFRRLGVAQQEVLRRLGRAFPSARADLTDVVDNQREAVETAAATCDYIDGAIEAYRVRRDERTEAGIRRVTVLAGLLWPVSLIIGLWGINFSNIPGTDASWGWFAFVAVQLILIAGSAAYFRYRRVL